jgi:hypothetical protein
MDFNGAPPSLAPFHLFLQNLVFVALELSKPPSEAVIHWTGMLLYFYTSFDTLIVWSGKTYVHRDRSNDDGYRQGQAQHHVSLADRDSHSNGFP